MTFEALSGKPDQHVDLVHQWHDNVLVTDWEPLVAVMLDPASPASSRAAIFHASLAHVILQQARAIRSEHDVNTVSFSGGVFQNRVLTEHAMALLSDDGFDVHLPELIPVNDAGISFGQVIEYGYGGSN
jgi:hydrogenase maturation protein HypF